MAKNEDVLFALELLHKNRPKKFFEKMMKTESGMYAVLKYLNDNRGDVKSKDISDYMNISSARMAVILKSMENKELIIKSNSNIDARLSNVMLSQKGILLADDMKRRMYLQASKIVDEFGVDNLIKLFDDINKVKMIMLDPMKDIMEENND